jgi:hypothetical protein
MPAAAETESVQLSPAAVSSIRPFGLFKAIMTLLKVTRQAIHFGSDMRADMIFRGLPKSFRDVLVIGITASRPTVWQQTIVRNRVICGTSRRDFE